MEIQYTGQQQKVLNFKNHCEKDENGRLQKQK